MKLLLIGYGKMSQAIERIAIQRGHSIVHIINSNNSHEINSIKRESIDLAIEFTQPDAAYRNIYKCLEMHIPVISGTTGWLDKKSEIENYCRLQDGTFFYATNYSIGMNLMFIINKHLAKLIDNRPEFSVEIEEIHHIHKKDKPSGTAITLANDVINSIEKKSFWKENVDNINSDTACLPIKSIRLNDTLGIHTVTYASNMEVLKLSHTATTRDAFALGVLYVAEWIASKKGVLSMEDFLER
jgi:4-hydroxy-tetrahydrodipicolinate reductase